MSALPRTPSARSLWRRYALALAAVFAIAGCASQPTPADTKPPAAVPDTHSSRTSLDWQGYYSGLLPCADCAGIFTELTLAEQTYQLQQTYVGKMGTSFIGSGSFSWQQNGRLIKLDNLDTGAAIFQVAEGQLRQRDMQGNPIPGELANAYVLHQAPSLDATLTTLANTWQLIRVNGGALRANAQDQRPVAIHFTAAGSIAGFSGCNRFAGEYKISNRGQLSVGALASTKMACMNDNGLEQELLNALQAADRYFIAGDQLHLLSLATGQTLTFQMASSSAN